MTNAILMLMVVAVGVVGETFLDCPHTTFSIGGQNRLKDAGVHIY